MVTGNAFHFGYNMFRACDINTLIPTFSQGEKELPALNL